MLLLRVFLLMMCAVLAAGAENVRFNRDVRPLLSDACFHCHGPDEKTRKAKMRLDRREGLGEEQFEEIIRRITERDPEERMPPPESGRSLDAGQVETLTEWIKQGAAYEGHWAYLPPRSPEVSALSNPAYRIVNPIDTLVVERSGAQAGEAGRATLIRRLSFDLTGLPPTPTEVDAFLADRSVDAYEKLVDRLLASPRYGERMAMEWLDAARYADSHGYSLDRRRVMWPWRDWVIRAYNDNMPFDRFMIEQLAGDLLPDASDSQKIATGFNRNHPIQSEGGVINEEYRVETVVDRVETTSAVFLGLTFGCARCHDHKYDPISQEEFYRFYAFFNSVPESAHVGNRDAQADKPFIQASSPLMGEQAADLDLRIAGLEAEVEREKGKERPRVEQVWIDDEIPAGAEGLGNQDGEPRFVFVSKPEHPVHSGERSSFRSCKGLGQHLVQKAKNGPVISRGTSLFAHVYLDPKDPPKQIMLQWNDGGGWEHRAVWGGDHIPWGVANSVSRHAMGPLPKVGTWVRLEVPATAVGLKPGSRLQGWAFTQFDGTVYWDTAGVVSREESKAGRALADLIAERNALRGKLPVTMIMGELPKPRKTFVLSRGQYDQPTKQEVQPGLPAVLGSLPEGPANRLALAKWLASPDNPLTARVIVNRYWQMYFGTGLVATPEDFGAQGEWPANPELLDWLATEFVRSGWDIKAMQKRIVMSATYRQASRMSPAALETDPNNRLLARGARFRLPAEMIRDHALFSSGLLVERLGGESVKPYQPAGLWGDVVYENAPRFKQDHGDKLYRRSMYTFWKRSVPPPNLQAFDAPSREACVLQRSRTNTPLAALVLMNDPTFVEASRKMAERMMREGGAAAGERLDFGFRLATSRTPGRDEQGMLRETFARLMKDFRSDPDAAKALMQTGEAPYDVSLDLPELAAYTAVANALLGMDETISKN